MEPINTDGIVTKLEELVAARASTWEQMKVLAFENEGGLASEDVEAYRELETELDGSDAEIAVLTGTLDRAKAEAERKEVKFDELRDLPVELGGVQSVDELEDREAVYTEAFDVYMRSGMKGATEEQRELLQTEFRALSTSPGTAGGFTIPEGFVAQIQEALKAFGGIRNAGVTFIPTGEGNDLPIPTDDDTNNVGQLLAENTIVPEQDVVFGQKVLKAWIWTSKMVKVPLALLQDSAFNLDAFLARKLGMRIGRAQAPFWVSGTGTNEPEGILTGTATSPAAGASAITYTDLVTLEHSVDPAYRVTAEYILSDSALKAIRLELDLDGRPIFAPGINVQDSSPGGFTTGIANSINGFGYTVDNNMPAATTGLSPLVFGDVSYYWIRDVLGIQMIRLDERFADSLQVAFLAHSRSDGRKVDAGDDPFKALLMA